MKKWLRCVPLVLALSAFGIRDAGASTAYGDLNNFDAVNDTGVPCRGFEIELDDIHSTDITYTYDWNHYGAPRIREDNADPAHPKVFVRYESTKNGDGTWAAFTAIPVAPITPTGGHSCTNPAVNDGCEHFGVGNYGVPTAVRYFWLIDDGSGNLVRGPAVMVASPVWNYAPPAGGQPAQAVAVIPAPVVPIPVAKQFGEPSWVKVIKTTTHNANKIVLRDLISDDADGDSIADWQNQEPAEVESEWKLLQTNDGAKPAKAEVQGLPDDMGDGSETVTRRYEFYKYAGAPNTLDGETGEAMCDEVNLVTDPADPNYLHGVGNAVAVTDANGDTYFVDCSAQIVVGDYIGAQMAGFDAAAPLGLVDNIQDGDLLQAYTPRTVVVGGNTPFTIAITGNFPAGLGIGVADGVLSGTPTTAGTYAFTIEATDADNVTASKAYTMKIAANVVSPPALASVVSRKVHGPAGTYDLPLSLATADPTTEPRWSGAGGTHTIVFAFDKAVTAGAANVTEGTATAGLATFNGNEMVVPLSGVADQQYVTVALTGVVSSDGGSGGTGSVRIGFLLCDVNQNRVVTLADLGLVNAQIAQFVNGANYLKDVNVSGTLSLADKGLTNTRITKALPAP